MDKSQVSAERKQLVVKSNEIVQKSRYHLGTQQQKLILYMISKIRPEDTEFKEYTFELKNLCKILNIDVNGANYYRFKESIKKIADTSFWLEIDGKDKLYRWIDDVSIENGKTLVKIKFDEDLKPFLLQLRESFTYYQLENVLCFDSKYSFRLYEIFQSYGFIGEIILSLDELKRLLMIENKYDRFSMFKVNVLNKAIDEINKYTDVSVSYELIRENRIITKIKFELLRSLINERATERNRQIKLGVIDDE